MIGSILTKRFSQLNLLSRFFLTNFKPTPSHPSFPNEEKEILRYWKEIDAFKQQLKLTQGLPQYSFYDGPPFATGTPHYGHIAAGTIKDLVCRYASMNGYHVQRRFGWDCHGLPIEYEIDKELKINSKQQVLEMGIDKYNQACRNIVMRYSSQWEHVVGRFGRWIDFKNDYKTMDLSFMESVWYVFKQLYQKGLVYRGRKIMPYSNACNTVLSNFEVQQNYKETSDPSLWVVFPLKNQPQVELVAWTTTPWTLPSNLALAVNPNLTYLKIKVKERIYIIAESRAKGLFNEFQVMSKLKGSQLQGLEYIPLFNYFLDRWSQGCFTVQTAQFVTDSDGTGIVHCAPGFGEEDYRMCIEKKLIKPDNPPVPIDQNGKFTKIIAQYEGIYVKDAEQKIIKDLTARKRVVKKATIKHNYPFCWRSDTPLIYKAVSSWFIRVTDLREDLVKNNAKAYWVPRNIQQKKFDNWLKDAKDWCFSRNRFWGNPVPLWVSDDGEEIICVGSLKQLLELTGQKVTDLHRENIDHLTIPSKMGKGKLKRIEQVFDCWFESGSMPFAQVHYPFSITEHDFQKIFPADFIGQGIDQTRGWFYTLNVIATALRNSNPYKNLIVNGLVLTENGKKMSKRLKNYPDPLQMCEQFGADAIRVYLINSPLSRADNLNFDKNGVKSVVKEMILPWYNAYRFLIQSISKYQTKHTTQFKSQNLQQIEKYMNKTDIWILSSLNTFLKAFHFEMKEYKLYNIVPAFKVFLEHLTNWYVRLNRSRLKGEESVEDAQVTLNVLFQVILKSTICMAPLTPFLSQYLYTNLKLILPQNHKLKKQSIHHVLIPRCQEKQLSLSIMKSMSIVMEVVEIGRKLREKAAVSLKKPIRSITILSELDSTQSQIGELSQYIRQQLNVQSIYFSSNVEKYSKLSILPNLPILGPRLKESKKMSRVIDYLKSMSQQELKQFQKSKSIVIEGISISMNEVILERKIIEDNLRGNQAIGGQKSLVLLDLSQDDTLRIRGYAREISTRIQKMKKRLGMINDQEIVFFYRLSDNSLNCKAALQEERQMIEKIISKKVLQWKDQEDKSLSLIVEEEWEIDQEKISMKMYLKG